jgi:hypothetical protein
MTQPKASVITDEMRAAIGRESEPVTFEVDKTACRMFARAVGYTDPVYFDEAEAKSRGYRSIPAPPAFLGHPVFIPGSAARPGGPFMFDTPLKRILNGGTDVEYVEDVCAGDVLTATTKLANLDESEGRLGPMLITNTETTFRDQAGKTVAIMRGTAIRY